MKISNVEIMGLESSIVASGYPMRTETPDFNSGVHLVMSTTTKDLDRAKKLTKLSHENGAHGQWLTGVRVSFDLTCSNKMWVEAERYRFLEFVSSQSTMHRITRFDIKNQYNKYVDPRMIDIMWEKIHEFNSLPEKDPSRTDKYLEILYSNPSGFELTARLTTNYRCLINIYHQRKDHRLPEWRDFCKYIYENLPMFRELVDSYEEEEK